MKISNLPNEFGWLDSRSLIYKGMQQMKCCNEVLKKNNKDIFKNGLKQKKKKFRTKIPPLKKNKINTSKLYKQILK